MLKSCETRSVEPYTRWFQVVFGVFFYLVAQMVVRN